MAREAYSKRSVIDWIETYWKKELLESNQGLVENGVTAGSINRVELNRGKIHALRRASDFRRPRRVND